MVAQVIINYQSKQTDKLFDYMVPEGMHVQTGSCVIVPFGRGGRELEGYVASTAAFSKAKKLKSICRVASDKPAFDEQMMELIQFMRNKYLCSYIDIIRTVIPAGISVKPTEWIIKRDEIQYSSAVKQSILRLLDENGGAMETAKLTACFDSGITAQIRELIHDGAIERQYREAARVRDKTVRVASLVIDRERAAAYIAAMQKKAKVQCRILDCLLYNEQIAVSDLVHFSEGTYQAVAALAKKGFIAIKEIEVYRDPVLGRDFQQTMPLTLTDEQNAVLCELTAGTHKNFLLHGVTGSGKTEVYMQAIEKTISSGKSAIMLVPEISLTPQTVRRFKERFGSRVAVFHSSLSLGEKYDEWKKMRDGNADIVIGARSAVFAPFSDIGMIIMDEEHEQTYKSEMSPRYHTREIAEFRAKQYGAVFLMASATPSVESYYQAQTGEYCLLEMKNRIGESRMPSVEVVDMRTELENGNKSVFSQRLMRELAQNLQRREQTILFLNRRGFSTFVSCRNCGFVAECPHCNISLTYHKYGDVLRCHYCGYTIPNYDVCPSCGSKYIRYFGGGTQKVEEEVHRLFPQASTLRMDVDTTSGKNGHEKLLNRFAKEKIDILIGTQMVTKGLDFPNVTLVGVVSADTTLHLDDFRSGERTFSMLEQVAGRAGRAKKAGRAIIQTYTPEHDAIIKAQQHDYIGFFQNEMLTRKAMWYPPMCDMVSILITGHQENLARQAALFVAKQLTPLKTICQKSQILGPVPAALSKIKNRYRFRILIKCDDSEKINMILTDAAQACYNNKNYQNISVVIDKNPNQIS